MPSSIRPIIRLSLVLMLGLMLGAPPAGLAAPAKKKAAPAAAPAPAAETAPAPETEPDEGEALIDLESAETSRQRAKELYERQQYPTAAELAHLAAGHYEQLAKIDPDRFPPLQMECLALETASLRQAGELDSAYRTGLNLLEKLKAPAKRDPATYLPFLAQTNQELAETVYALNPESSARPVLAYRQAAVAAYAALSRTAPAEYLPPLLGELSILVLDCQEFNLDEERFTAMGELLAASRRLAGIVPGERPALARNLIEYGENMFLMGRTEPGLAAMREGVDVYRELERAHPGAYGKALQEAEFILGSHQP